MKSQGVSNPSAEARPFAVPPQRTPVQYDPTTGGLRIGEHERRVDPSVPSQVYSAYLQLLYAVRGSKPGTTLPLRGADLEALLLIVGDDPETIEQRLIGLMGCTPEEASALGGLLLRHRRSMAALGIAAGLAVGLAGAIDPGAGSTDGAARGVRTLQHDLSQSAEPATARASGPDVTSVLLAGLDTRTAAQAASDEEPFALPVRGASAPLDAASPAQAVAPADGVAAATEGGTPVGVVEELPVLDAPPPAPEPADAQIGDAVSLFEDAPPASAEAAVEDGAVPVLPSDGAAPAEGASAVDAPAVGAGATASEPVSAEASTGVGGSAGPAAAPEAGGSAGSTSPAGSDVAPLPAAPVAALPNGAAASEAGASSGGAAASEASAVDTGSALSEPVSGGAATTGAASGSAGPAAASDAGGSTASTPPGAAAAGRDGALPPGGSASAVAELLDQLLTGVLPVPGRSGTSTAVDPAAPTSPTPDTGAKQIDPTPPSAGDAITPASAGGTTTSTLPEGVSTPAVPGTDLVTAPDDGAAPGGKQKKDKKDDRGGPRDAGDAHDNRFGDWSPNPGADQRPPEAARGSSAR